MGLVHVVAAVMLSSALLGVSVSFLSDIGVHERRMAGTLTHGLEGVAEGWRAYRKDHQEWACVVEVSDARCPSFILAQDGILPEEGWRDALFERYVFEPRFPLGFTLSYISKPSGDGFCLSGTGNKTLLGAAQRLQADAAINQVTIHADCGARQQGEWPEAESEWAITYWVNAR